MGWPLSVKQEFATPPLDRASQISYQQKARKIRIVAISVLSALIVSTLFLFVIIGLADIAKRSTRYACFEQQHCYMTTREGALFTGNSFYQPVTLNDVTKYIDVLPNSYVCLYACQLLFGSGFEPRVALGELSTGWVASEAVLILSLVLCCVGSLVCIGFL